MSASVLLDATPLASAHALRGIGAAVTGLLAGFAELQKRERPRLLVRQSQGSPPGFDTRHVAWPEWKRYRIPDPWPRAVGERLIRRRDEPLFHATQPALIPRGPGVVVTLYDLIPATYPEHYLAGVGRLPERRAYQRCLERASQADLVIAISQETANDAMLLLDIPEERIRVIPLGRSRPATPIGARPEGDYVLYSGGLEYHKNVAVLVEAMASVPTDISLVATGAWSDRRLARLQRQARKLGVDDRIEWRGHVAAGELETLRRGALAQVIPSLKEGFGLPALEAMSSGTAVVCSDTAALKEVAGGAAMYVPTDDAQQWADAMRRLVDDPALVSQMTTQGHERAHGFSWVSCAQKTQDAYRSLGAELAP